MTKVKFLFTVKYEGAKYAPHTPITVKEEEVDDMLAMGGILIEGKKPVEDEGAEPVKKTRKPRKTTPKEE